MDNEIKVDSVESVEPMTHEGLAELVAALSAEMEARPLTWIEEEDYEFPLTIDKIVPRQAAGLPSGIKVGSLVKVRVAKDKTTYVGFYLGDLVKGLPWTSIEKKENALHVFPGLSNPAMFVPELGRIVWGCESWWSQINSIEELKDISDEDIDNVWYVQIAKRMMEIENSAESGNTETLQEVPERNSA